ncbi:extracellular solute-binding protein [Agrobacterium larrymoorei]|uniref:Extracellular solute-binding protein n=1 Tax=Agrobacterium larrymoorei TaxID=160699 RepID=A0A4D7DYX7_9HYPH|nr:extracellular solute-binding protein [Agrobacterium larrymoorei]QCI99346.1 extracellular solute-binding protein [Agrobacterium larrymoorei]QYA08887.1 extracellular solute-binding protein [Agrobacterium larrymoorei]
MTFSVTTRRSTLKLLAAGTGMLAAPGLIRSASAQSKVVNITTYDKFVPQSFIDQFQKDTGIEVRIRLTDDQGKQYNLLSAEGATPSTDIVTVTGHRLSQFISSNLLSPLDTGRLKNWDKLASAYKGAKQLTIDGSVYGLPLLAGFEGLARNTDYTKPSDTWGTMFDDEYKGLTSYIITDFLSLTMLYQGNDGDYVTYEGKKDVAQAATNKARDFLIANKDKVRKYYDAGSEVQQMFLNEDVYIAQAWSGPTAKLIMEGHPIELSVPKEGTYGFLYSFNVVKNAPNADAAYTFLDAILSSPEIGASMVRQSGFASAFDGVDKILNDRERAAMALPQDQVERIKFFSSINRAMKNELIDRAAAEIKAA